VFFKLHRVENGFFVCIINDMGVGGKGSWGDKEIRDIDIEYILLIFFFVNVSIINLIYFSSRCFIAIHSC
jgi:hypothetical protein